MNSATKEKNTAARDGLALFFQFRLRYKELTGCRSPRAPSCVNAFAALVAEFGEERVFAALKDWVRDHGGAEELAENTHAPGDFLLQDAWELLRVAETIPRFTLLDPTSSWPPTAPEFLGGPARISSASGVSSSAQRGATHTAGESGRARQAFESLQVDAVRFPLFAGEIRRAVLKK
jgi:hypothetical protein